MLTMAPTGNSAKPALTLDAGYRLSRHGPARIWSVLDKAVNSNTTGRITLFVCQNCSLAR